WTNPCKNREAPTPPASTVYIHASRGVLPIQMILELFSPGALRRGQREGVPEQVTLTGGQEREAVGEVLFVLLPRRAALEQQLDLRSKIADAADGERRLVDRHADALI